MAIAYEGSSSYIFVSYSHRDSEIVMSSIDALQKSGFRVWFDGGIEAGSEWPEYIATHLKNSACVLTFISDHFVESDNCRRELNFAQDLRKPILNIYIHDLELSDGMRMQLGLSQALKKYNFKSNADFENALCDARLLKECGTQEQPAPKALVSDDNTHAASQKRQTAFSESTVAKAPPAPAPAPAPAKENVQTAKSKHPVIKTVLGWLGALLELSYAYFGTVFISRLTENDAGFWKLFLWMIMPHAVISILIVLLYRTLGKPLTAKERNNLSPWVYVCWLLSTIIAIIAGTVYCHLEINVILRFLSVLGLNVVPALFSVVMLLKCDY